jgi:hypothetical protein
MAPQILGNYEILEKLGEGAMGQVWRARDKRLGRFVAIKLLPDALSGDPGRRLRFEQEAKALGALNHPHVVAIYDVGESEGRAYIVSELVEGESLRAALENGPLALRRMLELAVQMAEGVAAAHSLGIVHRDLKPENVMLTHAGQVKVLDFGLAKQNGPATGQDAATIALSEPGMVVGTAGYMSPEQVRAEPVDARSDIFSLGCIFYEMIVGRRAFHADTGIETLHAILKTEPPEFEAEPSKIPAALAPIIRRCLEKRREQRFQSAADLAFALKAVAAPSTTGSQTAIPAVAAADAPQPRRWMRTLLTLAGAAVLLAGGYFVRGALTRQTAPVDYQRLTFRRGYVTVARFTPDGSNVVYGANWDGGAEHTYLTVPGHPDSRDLEMPAGAHLEAVSSRQMMALIEPGGNLIVSSLTGSQMRPLLDGVLAADWSPDGASLAVLRRVNGAVRLEYPIGTVLVDKIAWPFEMLRISPDGNRVAYPTYGEGSSVQIMVVDRSRKLQSLGPVSGQITTAEDSWLAWAPGGNEIWFHSFDTDEPGVVYAIDMQRQRRRVLALPSRVRFYDVAADGRALLSTGVLQIGILGAGPGATAERDLSCLDSGLVSAISQDGKMIVASVVGESGGPKGSVYWRMMDGSPAVRLGDGFAFAISPDSQWVAGYVPSDKGAKHFMVMPTGPGETFEPHIPQLQGGSGVVLGWLAGQQHFLVTGQLPGKKWQCFDWDAAHQSVRPVCPEGIPDANLLVSPDLKLVLSRGPQGGWFAYPADGGAPQAVHGIGDNEYPVGWREDNRSLFLARQSGDHKSIAVTILDIATGKATPWKEIRPAQPVLEIHHLNIAPNGAYAYNVIVGSSDLYIATGLLPK